MKRFLCCVILFLFCGAASSCRTTPDASAESSLEASTSAQLPRVSADTDDFPALPNLSPETVTEKHFQVSGDIFALRKMDGGFLLQYSANNSHETFLCLQDEEGRILWRHEISASSDSVHFLGSDSIFIRTNDGFACLDQSGSVLWKTEKLGDFFDMNAAFSDHAGGAYLLGRDLLDENRQCTLLHIDSAGKRVSQEPFRALGNSHARFGWSGAEGEYWLSWVQANTDKHFFTKMDSAFRVLATFALPENDYPEIAFLPEAQRVFLFGQAHTTTPQKISGFLYELDEQLNKKHAVAIDGYIPKSVIQLKDKRWLVNCWDGEDAASDTVKLFNAQWREVATIRLDYSFTTLFALDDGGFAVSGERLSPGQPYLALFVDSVRPRLDLVYERYDAKAVLICRKTYPAENSSSGYGYSSYVDGSGKIYLF